MASADKKPTLKQLQNFVIPHVQEIWEDLGIELDLDGDGTTLDKIRQDRAELPSKCCLDVMKKWLQGAGVEPKTWRTLLGCLRAVSGSEKAVTSIQDNVLHASGDNSSSVASPAEAASHFNPGACTPLRHRDGSMQLSTLPMQPSTGGVQTSVQQSTKEPLPMDVVTEQLQVEEDTSQTIEEATGPETSISTIVGGLPSMEGHRDETDLTTLEEDTQVPSPPSEDLLPSVATETADEDSELQHHEQTDGQQDQMITQSPHEDQMLQPIQPTMPDDMDTSEGDVPLPKTPPVLDGSRGPPEKLEFSLKLRPGQYVRDYQRELADPGIHGENYIICAPTGTGKTLVAALVVSDHLQKREGKGRVVFIVDKKPLARQQTDAFSELIPNARVQCSTGDDLGMTIKTVLPENDIVVCTAGKLLNELKEDRIHIDKISLVVIDECHHTNKETPHAKVLEKYLEEKQSGRKHLPQIIGLTASPGAGDNPTLDVDITIRHLISLCALMDATSGIKTVEMHRDELDSHTNKPTFSLVTLKHRDPSEEFVRLVTKEMAGLEGPVGLNCAFNKWTQKYETAIQQKRKNLEDRSDEKTRDKTRDQISVLELLWCYSRTLEMYMDLRYEDAITVLESFKGLPPKDKATSQEKMLIENRERLTVKLDSLPRVPNPLLEGVRQILYQQYTHKPDSKVIIFVRTKKHASSMREWASGLPEHLGIKPEVVTGHTSETGMGMTQAEQELALQRFHGNACNLLISTSVAEEGLDVPACNAVIRFQHVSNEIAKVQTRGRARAEDSVGFTILSSDTQKTIQEIRNGELESLVEEILMSGANSSFPRGRQLREEILARQEEIMRQRKFQKHFAALRGQTHQSMLPASAVQLKCKKCKTLACMGSDVYTLENAMQYVVPDETFRTTKISVQPRQSPKKITETMTVTDLIHCTECNAEWGNICMWPASGRRLPVLKCKSFTFEVDGRPQPVKKWSQAPFEVPPLSTHPNYCETQCSDSDSEATGAE